jgi:GT2 family glycosyltransferase
VDNSSKDGTSDYIREHFPWVKLKALNYNAGFAAACNLGAREVTGSHLVFLNPDTEVEPGFVSSLASFWRLHPSVGVVGGRINNEDGTLQPSVRGLPTVWSSLLDSLKLLGRLPWLAPRYLKRGFDYSKGQSVDQVMGACFSVPKTLFEALGGFDERYWVWFEEADFCARVLKQGLTVWYEPTIAVRHTQAASFRQLGYLEKHQQFTKSLLTYLKTHNSRTATALVWLAAQPWFVLAPLFDMVHRRKAAEVINAQNNLPLYTAVGLLMFELASWFGFNYPLVGSVSTLILAALWLVVAYKNTALGVVLLALELVVGSFGNLLHLNLGTLTLSLRHLLFVGAASLLALRIVTKQPFLLRGYPRLAGWYLAAVGALGWGSVVALALGRNPSDFFLDLQRCLYLLLFPLFFEAADNPHTITYAKRILAVGLAWLGLKTTITLYLFSHLEASQLISYYQWWRQTGFGEITYVSGNFFRVFSQSQVFSALGSALGFAWLFRVLQQPRPQTRKLFCYLFLWVNLTVLFMSFSRSFWLGTAAAWVVVLLPSLFSRGARFSAYTAYILISGALVLAAIGLTVATTQAPWPIAPLSTSSASLLADRLSKGEAASASRLALLAPLGQAVLKHSVVGSGFGATVTFLSRDPRLVRGTAGGSGLTTTYAFEWGYLDLWLKLGLLGLAAYLSFFAYGLWPSFRSWWHQQPLGASVMVATVALVILNITTPYLNHPLGIGALMSLVVASWLTPSTKANL